MADEFIRVWLTFSFMILGAAVLAAVWAARAGHFQDQERARRLALWAEVEESSMTDDGRRKTEDGRRKTEDGRRKTEDGRTGATYNRRNYSCSI